MRVRILIHINISTKKNLQTHPLDDEESINSSTIERTSSSLCVKQLPPTKRPTTNTRQLNALAPSLKRGYVTVSINLLTKVLSQQLRGLRCRRAKMVVARDLVSEVCSRARAAYSVRRATPFG